MNSEIIYEIPSKHGRKNYIGRNILYIRTKICIDLYRHNLEAKHMECVLRVTNIVITLGKLSEGVETLFCTHFHKKFKKTCTSNAELQTSQLLVILEKLKVYHHLNRASCFRWRHSKRPSKYPQVSVNYIMSDWQYTYICIEPG